MNKIWREFSLLFVKLSSNQIAIVLFLIAMAMFVVAAGAPEAGGSTIMSVGKASMRLLVP